MSDRERMLVVEDDDDLRVTIAQILADDWDVEGCANGRAALERLRDTARPPLAMIVLDVMMPIMNGWQFLEEKGRDPGLAGIPVVLMTAGRATGCDGVAAQVRKPFTVDELKRVLESVRCASGGAT
jgi:CheY-like chemotaxis protein